MTATAPPLTPGDPADWLLQRAVSRRRRVANALASGWMVGSLVLALVPLLSIVAYVVSKGAAVVSWKFLTSDLPIITRFPGGGIGPAVMGTLLITGIATMMAVPLGVLAAVYLNEYGKHSALARLVRFMSDVMTGVPSIVMGLFVATIWVSAGLHYGYSAFAGSIALGALMLPIVIRSSEEMLKLVPNDLRHASDALGARRWRTVLRVVLPAALPGIVSGAMLAVARAAGETAPLLFTIGAARKLNLAPFKGPTAALPTVIFDNAQQPFAAATDRAWGAALTLIALVFVFTLIARIVASKFATARR